MFYFVLALPDEIKDFEKFSENDQPNALMTHRAINIDFENECIDGVFPESFVLFS
jgi:hypothetical protein